MRRTRRNANAQRGHVRQRGGSWQVVMYAGIDPVTGERLYLRESTRDERQVAEIRARLAATVDKQRHASTSVELSYLLDEWIEVHELDDSTRDTYRRYIERTIKPALGREPISKIGPRVLEKFYARLRKCRGQCDGRPFIEHRTAEPHECREIVHRRKPGRPRRDWLTTHDCTEHKCEVLECPQHICRPLEASSVRQIHAILSGALDAAVRWEWIEMNPAAVAKRPRQKPPHPKPPTPTEAASIANAAWDEDDDWGVLVWLLMMIGPRRGEILALRVRDILFDTGVVNLEKSYLARSGTKRIKDTKTHQARQPALDDESLGLLLAHIERIHAKREALGLERDDGVFLFSYQPDHGQPCHPDGVTHRYGRMCRRIGIDTHMHQLRHYSATELIRAGVDVRTVAGRLGHGGGGTTTLRVYAAWVAESDKRAAQVLGSKMPKRSKA
ncbi:MAG: tyrosine-type recombinase/integrase [Kribbellaceae bacterium]